MCTAMRLPACPAGSPSEAGLLSSLSVASQLGGKAAIQSMELPDQQLMLQLVSQSAAQPGILTCWLDILALANNSAQFYVAELPAPLEGKPYVDVRRCGGCGGRDRCCKGCSIDSSAAAAPQDFIVYASIYCRTCAVAGSALVAL